ncbi:M14 family metallopeptidase [Niabella sp. CC-SYL272]|uniref:succinylglutamate desuccinylase/aspartoacylase family protein n=1 Tax=Niabella agricola TaxID=2891571 RepID=UPI001F1BF32B|nr:M14 family metallopeptidase [Niabella agricola]MCF3107698.1 M14 family metallopeptidase [Niabella agricola]
MELKGKEEGPHVLIIAGVHGDEYEPMITIMELHKRLVNALKKGRVTLICCANETAYLAGQRMGADGLDLARICPGTPAGTVSQQAAFGLSEQIRNCDYLVDLHTGGALFDLFPLSGYMLHADPKVLQVQRQMAAAFNLPLVWGTDAAPDGRTLSVARDAAIPAIYVEYGGGNVVQEPVIEAYTEGCLGVLDHLNMLREEAREERASKVVYTVEDATPDGGFLQGKMLSRFDGVFLPKVQPGSMIKKGDIWGVIYDPLFRRQWTVEADCAGLVLFVRRHPRVYPGDSLGGILLLDK